MALIPAGERPTETGAKSAAKIGRRELAIRIRGVRAFVAGETPGGHEWNQQNLKNGFLEPIVESIVEIYTLLFLLRARPPSHDAPRGLLILCSVEQC